MPDTTTDRVRRMSGAPLPAFTPDQVRAAARTVVKAIAGDAAEPRPPQLDALLTLLVERLPLLAVLATGAGKSAIYLTATRLIRDAGGGPTLVVSPLLALQRDQVEAARRAGLRATELNSDETTTARGASEGQLLAGDLDIVFVGPERLQDPRFRRDVLDHVRRELGLLVVDEAHVLSDWSHQFRPDFGRIGELTAGRVDLPILAVTATATNQVVEDVKRQLGPDTVVQRGSLDRPTLALGVGIRLHMAERWAWVGQALSTLDGYGIVYVPTRAEAGDLAEWLSSRGHAVRAYTGATGGSERRQVEEQLGAGTVKAVVATSALGLGIDLDLSWVISVGSPSSPLAYYQAAGRAGRRRDAVAVLLPSEADQALWSHFRRGERPDATLAARLLRDLTESAAPVSTSQLAKTVGRTVADIQGLLKLMAKEGAVLLTEDGWAATGTEFVVDAEHYNRLAAVRVREQGQMNAYKYRPMCLMAFLRRALDDPTEVQACGRCSGCLQALPLGLPDLPEDERSQSAWEFLRASPNSPRKLAQWMPRRRVQHAARRKPPVPIR